MSTRFNPKALARGLVVLFVFVLAGAALADRAGSKMKGTISAVDPVGATITVTPYAGTDATFNVTPATQIKRNGRPASLTDLQVGDRVEIKYDAATLNAYKIEAKNAVPAPPRPQAKVKGTVTAVDTGAGSLTVAPDNGAPAVTVTVGPGTTIERNDLPATLADIQVGDRVEVKYDPSTLVAIKIEAKSYVEVDGVVTAVDTGAGSLTVAPDNGAPAVTVTVGPGTTIERNDLPATLADIQVGDRVEVKYDPSTLVAIKIEAKSYVPNELRKVEGTVTAVDAGAGSLTVTPRRGAPVTVTVDASTVITKDKRPATLAQIFVGDRAEVKYNRSTLIAVKIEAKTPRWR